eukprot:m.231247 g.231247  ORF g.231247 m.231247 type:complete len:99 (+) comp54274_c0_seq6:298-594(+)
MHSGHGIRQSQLQADLACLLSEWEIPSAANCVNSALNRVRELLNLPVVQSQQSHSLRRGAATAMGAIDVAPARVLSWGGWANEQSLKPSDVGVVPGSR